MSDEEAAEIVDLRSAPDQGHLRAMHDVENHDPLLHHLDSCIDRPAYAISRLQTANLFDVSGDGFQVKYGVIGTIQSASGAFASFQPFANLIFRRGFPSPHSGDAAVNPVVQPLTPVYEAIYCLLQQLVGAPMVTTDGFGPYKTAIPNTLEDLADYAMLIKVYQVAPEELRYSPAEVSSVGVVPVMGQPDPERICTSIVERSNLSVSMGTRRCTRLTNAFSKKWENHWAAVSLWMPSTTFAGFINRGVTPAMAAGITDRVWDVGDLLSNMIA